VAKDARRRAEEAAAAQRCASSSYAAVRLPRAAPRPGTAVDAATAAAAGDAAVLVLFGRRWLPVRPNESTSTALLVVWLPARDRCGFWRVTEAGGGSGGGDDGEAGEEVDGDCWKT
jgi:hypothetical protein